jgi:mRNA-capping enzyme
MSILRYMMYIKGEHQIFFIDRDNAVFQINGLTFVSDQDCSRHLVDTLLDGEMVIDKDEHGLTHPRYLIYDCVSLEGDSIRQEDFNVRFRTIKEKIIKPRFAAMSEGRFHRQREPIGVRRKDFWPINLTEKLLSPHFKAELAHESDGLIFQPAEEPYVSGTCPTVLKWKPPSHNSVDFRLRVVIDNRPGMLGERIGALYVGGMDPPFSYMKVTKNLLRYNDKIIECRCDERMEWIFMRERTDKSFPNSYKTAVSVCQSIKEPVDERNLTNFIRSIAPSPPPSNHQRPPHCQNAIIAVA